MTSNPINFTSGGTYNHTMLNNNQKKNNKKTTKRLITFEKKTHGILNTEQHEYHQIRLGKVLQKGKQIL